MAGARRYPSRRPGGGQARRRGNAYTLSGVPLRSVGMGNIVALDSSTVAKWQAAITAATKQIVL